MRWFLAVGLQQFSAAIFSQVKSGDHIVAVKQIYGWTHSLITNYLAKFNVTHTFVDGKSMDEIKRAFQPNTKVLYLESPSTMYFEIQDLKQCATIARKQNVTTIVDNSYSSPLFQNPIGFGIDIVVHSGSKYINGHSDVVCGVLCSNKEIVEHIFTTEYMNQGAIISPYEAALILRGLRTLPIRMKYTHTSAEKIIEFLSKHEKISRIYHPFRGPQQALAKSQMNGAGGLFSIELKTKDWHSIQKFVQRLNYFLMAVSWGGYESLVFPMAALYDPETLESQRDYPINFVRIYIGLEDTDLLIRDLNQALEVI